MSKISPGADLAADASRQPAQRMVEAAKAQKPVSMAMDQGGTVTDVARMKLAAQKIVHTPETSADYAKRIANDKKMKGLGARGL